MLEEGINSIFIWKRGLVMSEQKPLMYGIIHIGSSSLSMRIVQYTDIRHIQVVESVKKDTTFGEEVFLHRKLSFPSIKKLCNMLLGLKQLMVDYQVKTYAVYATATLREAENCRSILDLIRVNTGFHVQVIDMPQEIYFKHFGLQYKFKYFNKDEGNRLGKNFLFVDITSGCVGLTIWENGTLCYQHNVHIGTLRLLEAFNQNQRDSIDFPRALGQYIHAIMEPLWVTVRKYNIDTLILSGREARIIGSLMNLDIEKKITEVTPEKLLNCYDEVGELSASMVIQKYHMDESNAAVVAPTIHIYREILANVPVKNVAMMGMTFIEAVSLFYGAMKTKDPALLYMRAQNLELTRSIAADFYYEPEHARAMELYSYQIIHAFDRYNGLNDRDEFLLRMAIILYQVGKYVNLLGSSATAWNIIRGTDIFGITDKEKDIVACIVYYDHKGMPTDDDEPFRILSESSKMTAIRLIAIFRLVRAMDMARKQKLRDVTARIVGDSLLIEYESDENTALETWLFDKEKELFENIFGMEAKLERR